MCLKNLNKKIKNLDVLDIGLTKISVAASILFVITIWPAAMSWVVSVNPWYFLIVGLILAIRPVYKMFK
jgi:hypothetical protein